MSRIRFWAAALLAVLPVFVSAKNIGMNQSITAASPLYSDNGQYYVAMQPDGNLVMYGPSGVLWQTNTPGSGADHAAMQSDGNFVLYRPDNTVIWQSNTHLPNSFLAVQDDGNLVIYWEKPIWNSNTADPSSIQTSEARVLTAGATFLAGQTVSLGQYLLAFQADGNLVLYKNGGTPIWSSGTQDRGADHAAMQSDGNFAIYVGPSTAIWSTQTSGNPGAYFAFQPDGNLVVYTSAPVWDRADGIINPPPVPTPNGPGKGICIGFCGGPGSDNGFTPEPFFPFGPGSPSGIGFPF